MDWIVKNALSRDTEREHLNKILAEIKARIDGGVQPSKPLPTSSTPSYSPSSGSSGGGSSGGSTAPKPVKITLTGDVTGEASGTSTISIATTLTNPGIQDAPVDGSAYWRLDGNWANVPAIVRALSGFDADGFLSWDSDDGSFTAREIKGTTDQIVVSDGLGIDADPVISLADLGDAGTGSFKLITRDTKGRLSGTTDGTTDDVPEGALNLYFTEERVREAVGIIPLIAFSYGDASPSIVYTLAHSLEIIAISLEIDTGFNGTGASISLGITGQPDLLIPSSKCDPSVIGVWEYSPRVTLPAGTQLILTIAPGTGASVGHGQIYIQAART